jgi:hypothetical protein
VATVPRVARVDVRTGGWDIRGHWFGVVVGGHTSARGAATRPDDPVAGDRRPDAGAGSHVRVPWAWRPLRAKSLTLTTRASSRRLSSPSPETVPGMFQNRARSMPVGNENDRARHVLPTP